MLTRSAHSVPSGSDRSGQPAWRRLVAVVLIALLSPVPALLAFWADANSDGQPDSWVDPLSGHVFTLAELDAFSDDIDGDGLSNAQEMAIGTNPFSPDTDGDGISDLLDPVPLSASNLSPANGIVWGAIALDDADGDGTPNFLDDYPYGQYGAQLGTPDTDGDGIPDFIDPAPDDPYNTSPVNGLQWMGDALADADGDGVPNFHDWYPDDSALWDPLQDPDGDGFVKARDPHPADPYNPSPVNGLNWGPGVYGDADSDGIPNFYDVYPYDSGNGYVPRSRIRTATAFRTPSIRRLGIMITSAPPTASAGSGMPAATPTATASRTSTTSFLTTITTATCRSPTWTATVSLMPKTRRLPTRPT